MPPLPSATLGTAALAAAAASAATPVGFGLAFFLRVRVRLRSPPALAWPPATGGAEAAGTGSSLFTATAVPTEAAPPASAWKRSIAEVMSSVTSIVSMDRALVIPLTCGVAAAEPPSGAAALARLAPAAAKEAAICAPANLPRKAVLSLAARRWCALTPAGAPAPKTALPAPSPLAVGAWPARTPSAPWPALAPAAVTPAPTAAAPPGGTGCACATSCRPAPNASFSGDSSGLGGPPPGGAAGVTALPPKKSDLGGSDAVRRW
mmetsp:Transcript_8616/g.35108  ORF Transcript_8616/g.35108 Transcript_8616/m.35108 type:complete len:263 (-) Transcript_8616:187-975(-)